MPDPCSVCPTMITCLAREMAVIHTICNVCRSRIGVPIDENWDPIIGSWGSFPIGYKNMRPCRRVAGLRKGKKPPRGLCTECVMGIKKNWAVKSG